MCWSSARTAVLHVHTHAETCTPCALPGQTLASARGMSNTCTKTAPPRAVSAKRAATTRRWRALTGHAALGECDRNQDLLTLCPVSCGVCTEMCLDKQNDCPLWAAAGECAKNPAYTLKECPNSCGVCGDHTHAMSTHPTRGEAERKLLTSRSACADVDKLQCLIQGEHECQTNPAAVMRDCPHTCGLCTLACEDKYSDCPNWAEGKANLFGNKSGKGCDEDKVSPEPHHASSPFASRQPRTLPQSWT